jgi:hypothetical protein
MTAHGGQPRLDHQHRSIVINPLNPAPRNSDNGRDRPPTAMALTPFYRRLIVLNPIVGAVTLALRLATTARGH